MKTPANLNVLVNIQRPQASPPAERQAHARRRQRERQTMKTKLQKLMKRGTATAVAVACSAWLCAGCDSGSFNSAKNRQAVVQKYSTEVWNLPGEKYRFIARKPDGSVWYVETLSTSQNLISAETELFSATK